MKIIGLTGGIGSGKTTVLNGFKRLGIPVYVADIEAKKLMTTNVDLKEKIKLLLGQNTYVNGQLNRAYIAEKVFKNKALLTSLNELVHPVVHKDFEAFCKNNNRVNYIVYESAILLQNKNRVCDQIIVVTADIKTRVQRVLEREEQKITEQDVLNRIKHQLSQEKMISYSDYQIDNNSDLSVLKHQVEQVHKILVNKNNK